MATVALPEARQIALGVVAGQAAVTGLVALACYAAAGSNAAQSAAIGGGIGTVASLAMVVLAFRRTSAQDAGLAARAFYVGEAAKVAIVIALFVLVLKYLRISAGGLFAGYAATFFVYWIALANAMPRLGGRGARAS
ncbi:MAG: ATP synthase subunit I [Steroidobacteraceae bacterium]